MELVCFHAEIVRLVFEVCRLILGKIETVGRSHNGRLVYVYAYCISFKSMMNASVSKYDSTYQCAST